jgi:NADH-quinone oxidoreductase subunit A
MSLTYNAFTLLVLLALALGVPAGMIVMSSIAGPLRRRRATDLTPYECGSKLFESARKRFSVKFYLVAMLFILFDIEVVFVYPWAIALRNQSGTETGLFVFWVMIVFLGILTAAFVYEWGRGALDWDR